MSARIDERTQFVDASGKPLVGGFIYIGTVDLDPVLNPKSIFSDRELTTALANPQTLDSFGRSTNKIWFSGKYSMKIEDSDNAQFLEDLDAGSIEEVGNTILTDVLGANTITANAVNTITSYVDGQTYIFTAVSNNTGATTLNIDSLGAKSIKKNYTDELIADDLDATFEAVVVYNGDNGIFQLINQKDTIASDLFPTNYLSGAIITRNIVDLQNFNVASGIAVDSTNASNMTLQAFTKLADTAWAVGSAAGALLTGTLTANTGYDIWAILTTDKTTTDYGIDTVANGITNIPSGYTLSRKIGRLYTGGDINILSEIVSENDLGLAPDYEKGFTMSLGVTSDTITSVASGTGASFVYSGATVLAVNDFVTISGFTTNTAYNGDFIVTITNGSSTFEVGLAFGTSETGAFTTPNKDKVDVTNGNARDSLNVADLIGPAMTKDISSAWVAGAVGGFFGSGTVKADTIYYFMAIQADADGTTDYGWDKTATGDNLPSGYTAFKLLSIMLTDSNKELIDSMQGIFRSDPQTPSTGVLTTLSHGLATKNLENIAFLHMVGDEDGYVVGNVLPINNAFAGNASSNGGVAIFFDNTEISFRYVNQSSVFTVARFTDGGTGSLSNANVRYRLIFKVIESN